MPLDTQPATQPSLPVRSPGPGSPDERLLCRIVRYLYDCLAAETDWARAVNVLEQKDLLIVPVTREQTDRLGRESSLSLSSAEAAEMGNRFAAAGSDASLVLGAMFLVGRKPASGEKPARRICAPLLEVPLGLRRDLAGGQIVIEPEEMLRGEIVLVASHMDKAVEVVPTRSNRSPGRTRWRVPAAAPPSGNWPRRSPG